jgi:YHS domain-containing protein
LSFIEQTVRNLIILILVVIALAMARWLLKDIVGAVKKALNSSGDDSGQTASGSRTGHMVRDPVSGTYLDETLAFREIINGKVFYFESKENRDTYLRQSRSS